MGVSLNSYLGWGGQLTHRQSLLWRAFREHELNTPSLTDNYIMQLTAVAARILASNPQAIQPENYKLTFTRKDAKVSVEDLKKQMEFSKAMWIGRMGGMKNLTIKDQSGNIIQKPEIKPKIKQPSGPPRQLGEKKRKR